MTDALRDCKAILHAGDASKQEILDQLGRIAPVYAVRGNNDKEWADHVPAFLDFALCGLRIYMVHKKKDIPQDTSGYDLVVYGHSHRYEVQTVGRTHFLNPGSCGPRRFHQDITMAVVEIDEGPGQFTIRRIDIPHEKKLGFSRDNIQTRDIENVIRQIKNGKTVEEIAKAMAIERELADQI